MNVLLVFDSSVAVDDVRINGLRAGDRVLLFPLTSRATITGALEKLIGASGATVETMETASAVNSAADRLRTPYIRFVAELPEKVRPGGKNLRDYFAIDRFATLWWFSLVAEKNTFKSEAFNRLAQLHALVETITLKAVDAVFFGCQSPRLREALLEYCATKSLEFTVLSTRQGGDLKARARDTQALTYLKHLLFLLHAVVRFCLTVGFVKKKLGGAARFSALPPELVCVTYFPNMDMELARRGTFRNRYYAGLQEALEMKGARFLWVIMYVSNELVSMAESVGYAMKFLKNHCALCFLEQFSSARDRADALLTMLKMGRKFRRIENAVREAHSFGGYNFYSLFKDDWRTSFAGSVGYEGISYYRMFSRLFRQLRPPKSLYYCEMHAWEKAMLAARAAVDNSIRTFGYQAGTVSRMLLNFFHDGSETSDNRPYAMPAPDRIVCDGNVPARHMLESGWDSERVKVAEALRYTHLKKYLTAGYRRKRNVALLAFSLSAPESSALLNIAHEALKDMRDLEVWVKPHPFLNFEKVLALSGMSAGDIRFQVKQEPMEDLLPDAKVVIAGESGVSIEALAFGCSVILVDVPEFINMSPLRDVASRLVVRVSSARALAEAVRSVIDVTDTPPGLRAEARRIVDEYFHLGWESEAPQSFLGLLGQ